ncbi:MAG: hypothetical protein ABIJ46_01455 [bacterium]
MPYRQEYREAPYSPEEIERTAVRRELMTEILEGLRDNSRRNHPWNADQPQNEDYRLSDTLDGETPPENRIFSGAINSTLFNLRGNDSPEAWELRSAILNVCRDFEIPELERLMGRMEGLTGKRKEFHHKEPEKNDPDLILSLNIHEAIGHEAKILRSVAESIGGLKSQPYRATFMKIQEMADKMDQLNARLRVLKYDYWKTPPDVHPGEPAQPLGLLKSIQKILADGEEAADRARKEAAETPPETPTEAAAAAESLDATRNIVQSKIDELLQNPQDEYTPHHDIWVGLDWPKR